MNAAHPHGTHRYGVEIADDIPLDSTAGIEAHGIDHIPDAERSGKARQLFGVWAASQVNYLTLVIGATMVVIGLTLWQAVAVIVVGSLFAVVPGLISATGPASGTPSQVVQRALFGITGNRVNQVLTGWLVNVFFMALNWSAAAYIVFGLLGSMGVELSGPVEGAVVIAIAAVTLVISVYGYNVITRLYQPLSWLLVASFVLAGVFLLTGADWTFAEPTSLTGFDLWATAMAGVTLIASGPLSYTNAADFARYLPASTPVRSIVGWVTLGFVVPGVLIGGLGAFVAVSLATDDPQTALESLLPGWFAPVFTIAVVAGTIANNAMTAYSSGLVLQTIGVRLRRSVTVVIDGLIGVTITLLALFVWDFLDTVSNLLQLIVAVVAPLGAVYLADMLWRRGRYDGLALEDQSRGSRFWYSGGFNLAGVVALVIGVVAALACISTTVFVGPVAAMMNGLDLSMAVGLVLPFVLYLALMTIYPAAKATR